MMMLLRRARVHFALVVSKQTVSVIIILSNSWCDTAKLMQHWMLSFYLHGIYWYSTKYRMLGLEIVTKPCISISTAPSAEIVWLKSDTVDHSSSGRSCYDKVVWVKQCRGHLLGVRCMVRERPAGSARPPPAWETVPQRSTGSSSGQQREHC